MLPTPPPASSSPQFRAYLVDLAERIAELRSETVQVVGETREAVRRSRELLDRLRATADGSAADPWARSNPARPTWWRSRGGPGRTRPASPLL